MSELPMPLVDITVDIGGLDGFMLDVHRLFASELWALSSGDEFKAAISLWGRAWQQKPAGSLPNDERILAAFSGAGSKWKKVKAMALRGFIECSDGRLYHRVLCEDVKEAAQRKAAYAARRQADKDRLNNWRNDKRNAHETRFNTPDETDLKCVRQGQGQGQGLEKEENNSLSPSTTLAPEREDFSVSPEKFERFWRAFEPTPEMSIDAAKQRFDKLDEADQDAAIAGAKVHAARRRDKPTTHPLSAEKFLRERRFKGFAVNGKKVPEFVFVKTGSPQWDAWKKYYLATKGKAPPTTDANGGGWNFASEWPPV